MPAPQNIIAVIFDFDDTLTDESTTKLLEAHGIDAREFWQSKQKELVDDGWDPAVAYLKLILDRVGDGRPMGKLTNDALRAFGAALEFYSGIPAMFDDLREIVKNHRVSSPSIEFYVVSSGLEEIIKGSRIAGYFSGIWGCCFEEENGQLARIRNVVSFTEKTKYIYAINKGVDAKVRKEPYIVNQAMKKEDRRIPFSNMIYVGDGLTDVPCFSLIDSFGGKPFGVFDPKKEGSPKKAWEQLVVPKRVTTMNSPRYGPKEDLGALLRMAVTSICVNLDLRSGTA